MATLEVDAGILGNSEVATQGIAPAVAPVVEDFSPHRNNGTMVNMVQGAIVTKTPGGVSTGSIKFDGVNDYIDIGQAGNFGLDTPFSVSFWINRLGANYYQESILWKRSSTDPWGWDIEVQYEVRLRLRVDAFTYLDIGTDQPWPFGDVWYHVVFTWSGASRIGKAYLNGTLKDTQGPWFPPSGGIGNIDPTYIGGGPISPWPLSAYLNGFAIFNRELSQSDVTAIYNGAAPTNLMDLLTGYPTDLLGYWRLGERYELEPLELRHNPGAVLGIVADSLTGSYHSGPVAIYPTVVDFVGGAQTGTMLNMAADDIVADSPGGTFSQHALNFKGLGTGSTKNRVQCPNTLAIDYETPHSWSFWLKVPVVGDGNYFLSKLDYLTGKGYNLYVYNGYLRAEWKQNSVTQLSVRSDSAIVSTSSVWEHFTITYDGTHTGAGVQMYKNGVPVAIVVDVNTLTSSFANTAPLFIGGYRYNSTYYYGFKGVIDELAVHNKVLTPSEVSTIYNGGLPLDLQGSGAPANLLAYWRMGESGPGFYAVDGGLLQNATAALLANSLEASNFGLLLNSYAILAGESIVDITVGQTYELDSAILADSLGVALLGVNFPLTSGMLGESLQSAWVFQEMTCVGSCSADSSCVGDFYALYAAGTQMAGLSAVVAPGLDQTHPVAPAPNPTTPAPQKIRYVPPAPNPPSYSMPKGAVRTTAPSVQTPIRQTPNRRG